MDFPRFNLECFEKSEGLDRRKRSKELDKMCSETGFLLLEGHGVSQKIISGPMDYCFSILFITTQNKKGSSSTFYWLSIWMDWT
jgi:isopenicillin N synthase-like dioxygenase